MAPFSQLHGTERGRNTQKGRVHAGHRKGGKATGFLPSGLWGKDHMETTTGDRCCRGSMLGAAMEWQLDHFGAEMVTRNGGRSQVAELGSHQPPRPMPLCLAWIPLSHHSVSYPPTYTPWLFPGSLYFLVALVVKNPPANAGDLRDTGSIPGLGWFPGEGHGNPLQHSCLENSMDRGAWRATVLGVARSQTRLSNWAHTHVFLAIIGVLIAQSCPTLCNSMDIEVHGILQTRILEWGAIPFSRGSSRTRVSCIAGRLFTVNN